MSRLIDADVLIEILTTAIRNMKGMAKFLNAEDDPEIKMEIKAYTDILNGVKEQPTIEPDLKWIPCSERPPEEEGIYFVTFNKSCLLENELPVIDAIWRDGQWQYGVLESYEQKMPKIVIEPIEELKVTAWMPLPEPYKEEN